MNIRIAGSVCESIVDGPGLRYVLFVQGCPHGCTGCQNPETHDFSLGYDADLDELFNECVSDPLHSGVTFSGGEPFCKAAELYELGKRFKKRGLHLMCYSGWTFEELLESGDEDKLRLLGITDVLVDGKFFLDKRSLSLKFRGSSNQRLIDVKKSLELKKAVVIEDL